MKSHRRACLFILCAVMSAVSAIAHPGSGIAVDSRGQVFFTDTGGGAWKIDGERRVTKIDGNRFHWLAIDPSGGFARGKIPTSSAGDFIRTGHNPAVILSSDFPVAVAKDGALYYSEPSGRDGVQLVRWTAAGVKSVFAILPKNRGGIPLRWINGIAAGPDGSLYYTENAAVRRVDARGQFSTVSSSVKIEGCIEVPGNEPDVGAYLRGLAVTADGTIYVAAAGCGAVIRLSPTGQVTPIHRTTAPWSPTAVAVSGKDIYVLEYLHTASEDRLAWIPRVRLIRGDGTSEILAAIERGVNQR